MIESKRRDSASRKDGLDLISVVGTAAAFINFPDDEFPPIGLTLSTSILN